MSRRLAAIASALAVLVVPVAADQPAPAAPPPAFAVPYEYFTLPNGLKVVVSPDRTAPIVLVEVIYNIGFRVEPKGRTGFAHLFEHMMFQGSGSLKKLERQVVPARERQPHHAVPAEPLSIALEHDGVPHRSAGHRPRLVLGFHDADARSAAGSAHEAIALSLGTLHGIHQVDEQAVPGGEQAGERAVGDADLGVDVLHVVARRLAEITSCAAICRFDSPRATSRSTSTSRAVSPAGHVRRRRTRWPAARSTASTASPSSRPARTSARSWAAALVAVDAGPVRPGLELGPVDVGGGEDPARRGQRIAGEPSRVAGAVEPLVVLRPRSRRAGPARGRRRASAR